jgi:hypothetical protein
MSMRRRVVTLERLRRVGEHIRIPIVWDGLTEQPWRARVAEARERGADVHVIRIGLMDEADSLEDAEAKVAMHRQDAPLMPFTVYRRGTHGREVLAEWNPDLPDGNRAGAGRSAGG